MTERVNVTGAQVNLFCDDVEACVTFFRALGLQEAFRTPSAGPAAQVEVDAGGVRIGLSSATTARDLVGLDVGATDRAAAEVVLWCDDVDLLHGAALKAPGGRSVRPPADSPDGRLRWAWVADPEGHQVKLVARR